MLSVFLLTLLLNGDIGMPLFAKFLLALLPTSLTIAYNDLLLVWRWHLEKNRDLARIHG
jgi:hypothetical protein